MKNKLIVILFPFITITPALLASDPAKHTDVQSMVAPLPVASVAPQALTAEPTSPPGVQSDKKQTLQDYDAAMIMITERFSPSLAAIGEAIQQGNVSSEQGKEVSAEQYQMAHMQFELLSLWREIETQQIARTPDAKASPAPTQENEIVTVALPFTYLELNPSLADYLGLTPSQVEAIQQVMMRERLSCEPLITQLRTAGEKLGSIGSDHVNEKQVKGLAQTEALLLARVIVANARMQSKIYKILTPEQQKKLSDLELTQELSPAEAK